MQLHRLCLILEVFWTGNGIPSGHIWGHQLQEENIPKSHTVNHFPHDWGMVLVESHSNKNINGWFSARARTHTELKTKWDQQKLLFVTVHVKSLLCRIQVWGSEVTLHLLNLQGKDRKGVKGGNRDLYFCNKSNCQRESKRGEKRRRKKRKRGPHRQRENHNKKKSTMLKHNRKWKSLRLIIKACCISDSMILRISGHPTVPWGQQPKKTSRLPISTATSCSYYGANTMAFSSQLRNVMSPVCPGSNPGPHFSGTCLTHLT